ncbi:MAG: PEGA domain-containing protein [Betaproteobacteria bacterium]|nr:MAG: PEGA domain-containing protein [Betaproteobacteria bacterium]TMH78565.1 MAG: PEGA domain-containing protein [Betaproteobacteria bacterium]
MATTHARFLPILFATALLGACGERLDIEVKASIDGQPASQAKVIVDREELGVTDARGLFTQRLRKKAGTEVEVTVSKEAPGYRIEPWKTAFLVKLPKGDQIVAYRVDADLKATRYVTVRVSEGSTPVPEAKVTVGGKEEGVTDAKGEFVYSYRTQPAKGAEIGVAKTGFSTYRATRQLEPGQVVEVALNRQTVVAIKAMTDEYGRVSGVPGLSVSIDGKTVGKTDAQGSYTYDYRGEPGKKAVIALAAPGYVPATWKTTVRLEGQLNLQHYFYPTAPRPIRIGIYRVVGNTPGVDLKEVAAQAEQALTTQLFKFPAFREVPAERLQAEVNQRKLSIERITTKGWQDSPLRASVDMIVLGSVAKDDGGYLVEVKFHTANGKIIFSEIARARSAGGINGAVRDIASNVIERFPLEGTVVGKEDDRYRINIGKNWRIGRGTEFTLTAPTFAEGGKVAGYRETGRIEVTRGEDASSLAEVATLKQGEKVQIGDRVVRRIPREGGEGDERTYFLLTAKGGVGTDVNPLPGTSVYLNGEWAGATGTNGQAEVPLRLGRNYTLTLYRHGYQQLTDKVKVGKSGEAREFLLAANNVLFKVDSTPSSATVYIDDEQIGKTPIAGKQITLGFHSVRLTYGEDYRDFFQVMEFTQKEEDRTGERRIVLQKDLLKIGERARQQGDIDGAIKAYASTEREHPDYAEAHRRLGDIYLDEKEDYDRAIAEFEAVLALPENQQLIYKQFAVTFTNLGHAYCEKGNRLVDGDRTAASTYFAKAIKALQTAKQNTRFFPSAEYDEAVHDTYYYTALSYHKLYLMTKQPAVMNSASLAWREYFDFFPKKLEGNPAFVQAREGARRYRDQIQEQ